MKTAKEIVIENLSNRVSPVNFAVATSGIDKLDSFDVIKELQRENIIDTIAPVRDMPDMKLYSLSFSFLVKSK